MTHHATGAQAMRQCSMHAWPTLPSIAPMLRIRLAFLPKHRRPFAPTLIKTLVPTYSDPGPKTQVLMHPAWAEAANESALRRAKMPYATVRHVRPVTPDT